MFLFFSAFFFLERKKVEGDRDECGCPVCPKCGKCSECRECPTCPTPIPCPGCPECPDVGRCVKCPVCKRCAPPVVFYVPRGALMDPMDSATPSSETENMIPGLCCRCPKRGSKKAAEDAKFVVNISTNAEEMRSTASLDSRIEEYKQKVEANRLRIRKLKQKLNEYEARLSQ